MTTVQDKTSQQSRKRGSSLKFKLLFVLTVLVTVITALHIALSSYLTYKQNQEEARQKLALQLRLFSQEMERRSADALRVAHDTVNNEKNLTDLGTSFVRYPELKQHLTTIMFFRTSALTQFQSIISSTGLYGIAVYVNNGVSHYMTVEEAGVEIVKSGERVIVNEPVPEDGNLNLKRWRSWASNPLPACLPQTLEMPDQLSQNMVLCHDALALRIVVPVQANIEETSPTDFSAEEVRPASPETLEQERQAGEDVRIIGGMVFLMRLDRASLAERETSTGMIHSILLDNGSTQISSVEFQNLPAVLPNVLQEEGQRHFDTLISLTNEAHYAMLTPWQAGEDTSLILGVALSKRPTLLKIRETIQWIVVVSLVLLLLVLLSGGFFVNHLICPIKALTSAARELSQGNFDVHLSIQKSRDEIGELTQMFQRLIDSTNETTRIAEEIASGNLGIEVRERSANDRLMRALNRMIHSLRDVAEVAEAMANGNLTVTVQERSEDDRLMTALNLMIERLQDIASQVQQTADNVSEGSSHLSTASATLAAGVSQQSSVAEEVSSSMEEMAANIHQIADNSKQTDSIARDVTEDARKTGKVVKKAGKAMQKIAEKILIIDEIAQQTRLLSLNATIEAGRAQEHGKAFSVVASEVRQLSDITHRAAEEITELASKSVTISVQAREMLGQLLPKIDQTSHLVQEISAASHEQSLGEEQVNQGMVQLDQVTQQNASMAEELAASAEELAAQSHQLQEIMSFFTLKSSQPSISSRQTQPGSSETVKSVRSQPHPGTPQQTEQSTPPTPFVKDHLEQPASRASSENQVALDLKSIDEEATDRRDNDFERY